MNATPIQVLHVIGGTGCGGTETWLTNMLSHAEKHGLSMSFLVHTNSPGHYDELILKRGGRIYRCPNHRSIFQYSRSLRSVFKPDRFHVIHSHVSSYSGIVLRAAHRAGIPTRIAHSHHTRPIHQSWARGIYRSLMHHWINQYATHKLAASEQATTTLGSPIGGKSDWQVLHCGIDLQPFEQNWDRESLLGEMKLDSSAKVIGHLGRFVPEKNHAHLLDTFRHLISRDKRWQLLLIGDGPGRRHLEQRVNDLQLTSHVRFLGIRSDIARLLKGLVDVFVFPSTREGLGLSLVEAQAAGIRCIASTAVPDEATVVPELVTRLPASADYLAWADAVELVAAVPPVVTAQQAWSRVNQSDFDLEAGTHQLRMIYQESHSPEGSSLKARNHFFVRPSAIAS